MSRRFASAVALGLAGVLTATGCSSSSKSGAAAPATSAATKAAPTSAAAPAATSKAPAGAPSAGATSAATSTAVATTAAASPSGGAAAPSDISGDITVLSHRTDLQADGTYKKYIAAFNVLYPKIKVKVETITDYEGVVKIRMNTKNYGDVLMIPRVITLGDYPKFFSPLGSRCRPVGEVPLHVHHDD